MGNDKPQLYIRFPKNIEEELEVKNLCIKIETVRLPRQKSARWCIVEFKTKQDREEAIKILKSISIEGKRLVVKAAKRKRKTLSFENKCKSTDSIEGHPLGNVNSGDVEDDWTDEDGTEEFIPSSDDDEEDEETEDENEDPTWTDVEIESSEEESEDEVFEEMVIDEVIIPIASDIYVVTADGITENQETEAEDE